MKIKNHVLCMMAIASLLVSCNSHPKFETSVDAVEGCKKELAALKGEKEMSIEQLTKATSSWLEHKTRLIAFSPVTLLLIYEVRWLWHFLWSRTLSVES